MLIDTFQADHFRDTMVDRLVANSDQGNSWQDCSQVDLLTHLVHAEHKLHLMLTEAGRRSVVSSEAVEAILTQTADVANYAAFLQARRREPEEAGRAI